MITDEQTFVNILIGEIIGIYFIDSCFFKSRAIYENSLKDEVLQI